jgi:hypothetical protein
MRTRRLLIGLDILPDHPPLPGLRNSRNVWTRAGPAAALRKGHGRSCRKRQRTACASRKPDPLMPRCSLHRRMPISNGASAKRFPSTEIVPGIQSCHRIGWCATEGCPAGAGPSARSLAGLPACQYPCMTESIHGCRRRGRLSWPRRALWLSTVVEHSTHLPKTPQLRARPTQRWEELQ